LRSTDLRLAEGRSINLSFVMAQVVGRSYSAMFGFENEADAARATALIKKAAAPVRKR
jgi:hypothetical protein